MDVIIRRYLEIILSIKLFISSQSTKMQGFFLLVFCVFLSQGNGFIFKNLYKDTGKLLKAPVGADVGEPLILTEFIKNGSILEGQQAALVQNAQFQDVVSYAGYFTVDERFDSNMWFWYFPSKGNVSSDPVILWLNGGPGATSLNGLFDENGPFIVNADSSVSLREYSWHLDHSVIFIDNPVGVGFSFTNGGFAENETKVGDDMYSCLTQFFQLFPDLQQNPFYISGESYAGKYLPAIGYAILKKSPQAELKINLQGILIGDGWTDPVNQLNYGPFVYNVGLVSAAVKEDIDKHRDDAIAKVQAGDWLGASDESDAILFLIGAASDVNIYNYIIPYDDPDKWVDLINTEDMRKTLHVGNTPFSGDEAGEALSEDEMHSVAPWLEELLENYRVLIYVGQVDIIVGYPMVQDYLNTLNFTGVDAYQKYSRDIWYVDEEPAGYVKIGGNLVELLVRNAGHMVPRDQPKSCYDMLYRFTRNIPFV